MPFWNWQGRYTGYGALPPASPKPIDPNDPGLYNPNMDGGWDEDGGPGGGQTGTGSNFGNMAGALGAVGLGASMGTGVPGLGAAGAAAGTALDQSKAEGLYTNYPNPLSYKEALESNLTFGNYGKSFYDQTWQNADPATWDTGKLGSPGPGGWDFSDYGFTGDPDGGVPGIDSPSPEGAMYASNQSQSRDYTVSTGDDSIDDDDPADTGEAHDAAAGVAGGEAYDEDGGGGGGGGGGWVICTHLMDKGLMEPDLYYASANHVEHMSPVTLRGYRWWAVPFVRLMRRHPWLGRAVAPIAEARARELRDGGSGLGKLVRVIGEPLCWTIGLFVDDPDWESLYDAV